MLVSFSFENFRSFKDNFTLSMEIDKSVKEIPDNTISTDYKNITLLRSAVVYGANASGKSNIIKAFTAFQRTLSSKNVSDDKMKFYDPFIFDDSTESAPIKFEVIFILDQIKYKYTLKYNSNEILSESLYFWPQKQPAKIFDITNNEPSYGEYLKSAVKAKSYLDYAFLDTNSVITFLSKASNTVDSLKPIFKFLTRNIKRISEATTQTPYEAMEILYNSPHLKEPVLSLLKAADIGINNFNVSKNIIDDQESLEVFENIRTELNKLSNNENRFPKPDDGISTFSASMSHEYSNNDGSVIAKKLDIEDESLGTNKIFDLSVKIILTLMGGFTLIIDELDASIHTELCSFIVSLFNNSSVNAHNAQIIFTTHNTNLMTSELFRRDQIKFVEKDKNGASVLYSLSDFPKDTFRKGSPFEDWYLDSRLGAFPQVKPEYFSNAYKKMLTELLEKEDA